MGKKRISKKFKKKVNKSQKPNSSSPIIQGITYSNIKFIKNNHKDYIIYMNLIHNKKYILAASEYKITIHDPNTYNQLSEKKITSSSLTEIIELTNGNIVAISNTDYYFLKINDDNSIEKIKQISYMNPLITSGLFQVNDEIIAIGRDKFIFFYDFIKYENFITLTPDNIVRSCIQLNDHDNMMLISDKCVAFYNLLTYDQYKYFEFPNNEIKKYIFLDKEDKEILFYSENFIGIYNVNEEKLIKEIKPKIIISCLIKLKDKNNIVIGGTEGTIFVYNLDSDQNIINYKLGNCCIYGIFELSNDRILFNCTNNKIVLANYIQGIIYYKKKSKKITKFKKGILMDNNDLIIGCKGNFIILN